MYSFTDYEGDKVFFDSIEELFLEESEDIVTGKISAYFIEYDEKRYRVDESTYEAINEKKK